MKQIITDDVLQKALKSYANKDHAHSIVTQSKDGFMSKEDKIKLDGISTGANKYTLPVASSNTRGGVKVGYNGNGRNYPVKIDTNEKMYVTIPWSDTNTTYGQATSSTLGLVKLANNATSAMTDGTMTAYAIKNALNGKASSSHTHSQYSRGAYTQSASIASNGSFNIPITYAIDHVMSETACALTIITYLTHVSIGIITCSPPQYFFHTIFTSAYITASENSNYINVTGPSGTYRIRTILLSS